jgi:hypothetical protein
VGPKNIRPSLSIDRSSTSPLRKSACDDTVQKVGTAATSVVDTRSTKIDTAARLRAADNLISMDATVTEMIGER